MTTRTTLTEEAIDQLLAMGQPRGRAVNVPELMSRMLDARAEDDGVQGIEISIDEAESFVQLLGAVRKVVALDMPVGVVLTKPWLELIGVMAQFPLEPLPDAGQKSDCLHDTIVAAGYARPGAVCQDCGAFASERRIFEESLNEDGSIDDRSTPKEAMGKRMAAIRHIMDNPET